MRARPYPLVSTLECPAGSFLCPESSQASKQDALGDAVAGVEKGSGVLGWVDGEQRSSPSAVCWRGHGCEAIECLWWFSHLVVGTASLPVPWTAPTCTVGEAGREAWAVPSTPRSIWQALGAGDGELRRTGRAALGSHATDQPSQARVAPACFPLVIDTISVAVK